MIDIEPELYNMMAEKLREQFNNMFVTDTPVSRPPSFPAASVSESTNTTDGSTLDCCNTENHALLAWQAEVYSNNPQAAKYQCKEIVAVIDDIMLQHNFVRTMGEFVPNADAAVTRYMARYIGKVGKDQTMYRR